MSNMQPEPAQAEPGVCSHAIAELEANEDCPCCLRDAITRLEAEFEKMEAALDKIRNWAEAYPLDMFPEPTKEDWKEIARLLKDNGYLIDSVTSSNMRHVINGVKALVEDVLDRIEGE